MGDPQVLPALITDMNDFSDIFHRMFLFLNSEFYQTLTEYLFMTASHYRNILVHLAQAYA